MLKRITLELSLKPFQKTDEGSIYAVCEKIFRQWQALLQDREEISVMLWCADGSEILEYAGDLDKQIEWDYYVGSANCDVNENDESIGLHERCQHYMENPPKMTYRVLYDIVCALKEVGKRKFPDSKITVGETFDIGPEFAKSDFKYNRHKEICTGAIIVGDSKACPFVDATAVLHADTRAYASYPNGIPEGTPFGEFLGKQTKALFRDIGFDYLWFSNGFGFSADPWGITGKVFDGNTFHTENLRKTKEKVLYFWEAFRKACPDIPVEVRGTNNSVGIDYASDGVPLYDLYTKNLIINAPPNSPWAALNGNFGLELMGHMSRVCNLPQDGFMFRFYVHDPWWVNSPWYDRYGGFPHDIYLPMAISRIDDKGKIQTAERVNILTIDNSFGDMPDCCVNEPLPHLLKGDKDAPDDVCLLVWVYPMREFTTVEDEKWLYEMYNGDTFVAEAINNGLPLNCVVSTDNFIQHDASLYQKAVLISPLQPDERVRDRLIALSRQGTNIIFYGTKRDSAIEKENQIIFVDIAQAPAALRESLQKFGYTIEFDKREDCSKLPVMTIAKKRNGYYFSVYNRDTTTDTRFKFPLGAPLLMGGETQIKDGFAMYRFSRFEHRECRIFVKQQSGVVSANECAPVNAKYRRRILVSGLNDATVYYFPETEYIDGAQVALNQADETPILEEGWTRVNDEKYGMYYYKANITGERAFLRTHK